MDDVEAKVDAMLRSPLGCAFLRQAEASGLPAEEIVSPLASFYMCANASWDVDVWHGDYQRIRTEILRLGQNHRDLAISILEQPAAASLFESLDKARQVVVPLNEQAPTRESFIVPTSQLSNRERHHEMFKHGMFTSTLTGGTASIFVALDQMVGDIGIVQETPYKCWLLKADPSARVFEIDGAQAWHDLCARYPTAGSDTPDTPDFSMDAGRIVPDWYAVARDWDAVHVSFGAMLMTDKVRVESEAGWTFNWDWHIERTLWLRWVFSSVEPLPDHEKQDSPFKGMPLAGRF